MELDRCPVFQPRTRSKMKRGLQRGRLKERGFALLGEWDALEAGPMCRGDGCGIDIPWMEGQRGAFHTHTSGNVKAGWEDLKGTFLRKDDMECIGGKVRGRPLVRCYVRARPWSGRLASEVAGYLKMYGRSRSAVDQERLRARAYPKLQWFYGKTCDYPLEKS